METKGSIDLKKKAERIYRELFKIDDEDCIEFSLKLFERMISVPELTSETSVDTDAVLNAISDLLSDEAIEKLHRIYERMFGDQAHNDYSFFVLAQEGTERLPEDLREDLEELMGFLDVETRERIKEITDEKERGLILGAYVACVIAGRCGRWRIYFITF